MIEREWFLPSNTSSGGSTYMLPILSETLCIEYSTRAGEYYSFNLYQGEQKMLSGTIEAHGYVARAKRGRSSEQIGMA